MQQKIQETDRTDLMEPVDAQNRNRSAYRIDPESWSALATSIRILILVLATVLVYHHTLHGPFVFDDFHNVSENPHIRLARLSLPALIEAGIDSPNPRRVFAYISFALNWFIHADEVFGYHLVNLILHMATGILLYFFARTTLQRVPSHREKLPVEAIAFFAALIWIVHPIQTQAVTYIVQRMTVMAAFFYLCALLCYVKARLAEAPGPRAVFYGAAVVTGILAMGSKEIAVTLPFFVILYEWYFFRNLDRTWLKKHIVYLLPALLLAASGVVWATGSHSFVMQFLVNGYAQKGFTLSERLLTEFRIVVYYISLLAWPDPRRLHLDYDFPLSRSMIDPPTTLLAVLLITGLLVLALVRADKNRLMSFGILWFLGNLVIESTVLPLDLVYEHRLYLPSMFLAVLGVSAAYRWFQYRRAVAIGLCLVAVGFSLWSFERNSYWRNAVALWEDNVAKTPQNARAYNNLGHVYYNAGNMPAAIENFRTALALEPDHPKARYGLGLAMIHENRYDEAETHLLQAIEATPDNPAAYNALGALRLKQNRVEAAIEHLRTAVKLDPQNSAAHNNLGAALARQGHFTEAFEQYRIALKLNPEYAEAYNNVGMLLLRKGRDAEAADLFKKALQLDPQHDGARKNLDRLQAEGRSPTGKVDLQPAVATNSGR
jgi:Flp pilus assembly protein TadD